MPLMIAFASFVTVFTLFFVIYRRFIANKQFSKQRIERYIEVRPSGGPGGLNTGDLSGFRLMIRGLSRYLEWAQLSKSVGHKLQQAGLPLRGSEFMVICLGAALLGLLMMLAMGHGSVVWGFVGGAGGYLVPLLVLRIKISRRAAAFNNLLGDSLTLIANSLRTGYSFLQAVEMVSREMPQPVAGEFARVLKEMSLGVTTEDAMNNLAKRVDSNDLDLVVTAVLIQRQVGGNLAEVLDNISGTIRQRIRLRGEVKTLTAQGRISGLIVGLLPFVLGMVIYLLNPEYLRTLFTHPAGIMLVVGALVSQTMGVLIIRRIVNIEL